MEEAVGRQQDPEPALPQHEAGREDRAHRSPPAAGSGAEGGEVMRAPEEPERARHGLRLQDVRRMPRVAAEERIGRTPPVDQVAVALAPSPAPGVESRRRLAGLEDADRGGEQGVERAPQRRRGHGRGDGQARHLPEGVDAGIGPARPHDLHALAQDALAGLHQESLDRRAVGLGLPAGEVRAIVGQGEAKRASHAPRPGAGNGLTQRIRSSAIWIPLSAAPLRSWSPTTQKLRPLARDRSSRMRPTKQSSWPSTATGIG